MADNANVTLDIHYSSSVQNFNNGKAEYDDTTIVADDTTWIETGFRARRVTWLNATDRIRLEWYEGMDDNTCIKYAASGAATLETDNGITVDEHGFRVSQNATLGGIAAEKDCYWEARG